MLLLRSKQAGPSKAPKSLAKPKSEAHSSPPDDREQDFWNTPGPAARTLHFTGELLTDEQIDMGELSASLESPLPSVPRTRGTSSRALQFTAREPDVLAEPEAPQHPEDEVDDTEHLSDSSEAEDDDDDVTVILEKPPVSRLSAQTQRPPNSATPQATPQDSAAKRGKTKVTLELENIVVSITIHQYLATPITLYLRQRYGPHLVK